MAWQILQINRLFLTTRWLLNEINWRLVSVVCTCCHLNGSHKTSLSLKPREVPAPHLLPPASHPAAHQTSQSHRHWCHQTCSSHQTGLLQYSITDYNIRKLINSTAICQNNITPNINTDTETKVSFHLRGKWRYSHTVYQQWGPRQLIIVSRQSAHRWQIILLSTRPAILRLPYTRHVSNAEVSRTTGCSLLSHLVT